MNNNKSEMVSFLAQEAEKNIKGMLEHGLFREAGISTADVNAAIVCKPGYDAVKNRVIADVGQGVYGDRFFAIWSTDDVIYRAEDWHDVHFTEDAALRVLEWLDNSFDADNGINWGQIDVGIDIVLEELAIEAKLKKGSCDE